MRLLLSRIISSPGFQQKIRGEFNIRWNVLLITEWYHRQDMIETVAENRFILILLHFNFLPLFSTVMVDFQVRT